MSENKAEIMLGRILDRIDKGEFDKDLDIPFASRKLLKALVQSKMDKKVETNATPVLSDLDLEECVKDVRATAAEVAAVFGWAGILEKTDKTAELPIQVTEKWDNILKPKK